MFNGVPIILVMLPVFALAMIAMIRSSDQKNQTRARHLHMVEPDQRSWFDHENQVTEKSRKRAA
jgi:hypothetical protein